MAKSVGDLAALTEILLEEESRSRLPHEGFAFFLQKSFKNLTIGFLDPAVWRFPDSYLHPIADIREQMVRPESPFSRHELR